MTGHGEFGWGFRQVQIVDVNVFIAHRTSSFGQFVLETYDFFLEGGYFFLKRENGLPLDLEFFTIGVNIVESDIDLL